MSTLTDPAGEVVRFAITDADSAVVDAYSDGQRRTQAEYTKIAVDAAIRGAVRNGWLLVPDDLEQRMKDGFRLTSREQRQGASA